MANDLGVNSSSEPLKSHPLTFTICIHSGCRYREFDWTPRDFIKKAKDNGAMQKSFGTAVSVVAFWYSINELNNDDSIEKKLQFLSATASLSSGLVELSGSSQVIKRGTGFGMYKRYVGQSVLGFRLTAIDYILAAAADGVQAYKRYKDCDYDSSIAFGTAASLALASYFISNPAVASAVLATSVGASILGGILSDSDIKTWLKYSYHGKKRQKNLMDRPEKDWSHYAGWHHITQQIADFHLIPYSDISLRSPQVLRPYRNDLWPLREPDLLWESLDIDLLLKTYNYKTTSVYLCVSIDSVFFNRQWPIDLNDEEKQFFREELTPEKFILAEKNESDKEEICLSPSLKPTSASFFRKQNNAFYLSKPGFRKLKDYLVGKTREMDLPDVIRQMSQDIQVDLRLQFFIFPEQELDEEGNVINQYDINSEEGYTMIKQFSITQEKLVKGLRL